MNASNDNAARPVASKKIVVWDIKARDFKLYGKVVAGDVTPHHHAEIVPGVSVRLFGMVPAGARYVPGPDGKMVSCEEYVYRRDFKIGDVAEYSSFNMSYTGTIASITEKTVSIVSHGTTRRLSLHDFDRRNWNFDEAASDKRNAAWMD